MLIGVGINDLSALAMACWETAVILSCGLPRIITMRFGNM